MLCKILEVSRNGYYAWDKRPESEKCKEDKILLHKIETIHTKSNRVYGSKKITKILNNKEPEAVKHKRVERIMKENNIKSKVKKKYKATTNSNHSMPVADNVSNRNFEAKKTNEKWLAT